MTSYESACLLIALLNEQGIESNITVGGVKIFYKRHQRKTMLDTLNALKNNLKQVETIIYLLDTGTYMYVNRHESKPIDVSHKRTW